MTIELPAVVQSYVKSINAHDPGAFLALFADDAVVNDVGREFCDRAAIKAWSDREIFGARVVLEVLDAAERDGETILMTKVDGHFDRTGLPDPVIIDHQVRTKGAKIVQLTCRLSGERNRG